MARICMERSDTDSGDPGGRSWSQEATDGGEPVESCDDRDISFIKISRSCTVKLQSSTMIHFSFFIFSLRLTSFFVLSLCLSPNYIIIFIWSPPRSVAKSCDVNPGRSGRRGQGLESRIIWGCRQMGRPSSAWFWGDFGVPRFASQLVIRWTKAVDHLEATPVGGGDVADTPGNFRNGRLNRPVVACNMYHEKPPEIHEVPQQYVIVILVVHACPTDVSRNGDMFHHRKWVQAGGREERWWGWWLWRDSRSWRMGFLGHDLPRLLGVRPAKQCRSRTPYQTDIGYRSYRSNRYI